MGVTLVQDGVHGTMRNLRLSLLLCLLMMCGEAAPGDTIRITTGEWIPFSSESLKHTGFTNHVIAEAFKLEGYSVEFTFYPWKRAFEAAKSAEEYHATSYWYPSDERAKDFHYSEPLQVDDNVFFHLKSTPFPDWETLDDLKKLHIGAVSGFTYTEEFWEAEKSGRLSIDVVNSEESNFRKLMRGRIDTCPTARVVGLRTIRGIFGPEGLEKVTFHPKPLFAVTGHLLVSKKNENAEEIIEAFNRGLAALKESGRYEQFQEDLVVGKYDQ